jgi:hypothetical protein
LDSAEQSNCNLGSIANVGPLGVVGTDDYTKKEPAMMFIVEYQLKPHMPKAETKRLMEEFGKRGAAVGEIAHYVKADGTGGYTIGEDENLSDAYEAALAYSEFMTITITPVLKIDDALGPIAAYLG